MGTGNYLIALFQVEKYSIAYIIKGPCFWERHGTLSRPPAILLRFQGVFPADFSIPGDRPPGRRPRLVADCQQAVSNGLSVQQTWQMVSAWEMGRASFREIVFKNL